MARAPGSIRDAIIAYLSSASDGEASIAEIREAIGRQLGDVSPSSIRSYLNLNVPEVFERVGRGRYRLKKNEG
jgi:site-specific DNA-methyltransferase (adenine-specific)